MEFRSLADILAHGGEDRRIYTHMHERKHIPDVRDGYVCTKKLSQTCAIIVTTLICSAYILVRFLLFHIGHIIQKSILHKVYLWDNIYGAYGFGMFVVQILAWRNIAIKYNNIFG